LRLLPAVTAVDYVDYSLPFVRHAAVGFTLLVTTARSFVPVCTVRWLVGGRFLRLLVGYGLRLFPAHIYRYHIVYGWLFGLDCRLLVLVYGLPLRCSRLRLPFADTV
jgi:hypothetical protein